MCPYIKEGGGVVFTVDASLKKTLGFSMKEVENNRKEISLSKLGEKTI